MSIKPNIWNQTVNDSVSRQLADSLHRLYIEGPLPTKVSREAQRSWVNVVHTALGASQHQIVDSLVAVHGGPVTGDLPLLARAERSSPYGVALVTGAAAHIEDFDDTHLATVIHPGAACLGSSLAIGLQQRSSGASVLAAFALGIEAQLRLGVSLTPSHYDEGWHITGTCGGVGAAVSAGLLLDLSPDQLAAAIDIAATTPLGHREGFGSAVKPFHPGKAAAIGVLAASLAQRGARGNSESLEGTSGLFSVFSPEADPYTMLTGIGTDWELLLNAYKPYPCGIVSHPAMDAAVNISASVAAKDISAIDVDCHPLVPELTGNPHPTNGLQAKFSTVHGVAAGLAAGTVGLDEYADSFVTADSVARLRSKIRLIPRQDCRRDEAGVTVHLADGTTLTEHVDHARGSLARPLTDHELNTKAMRLTEPVLPGVARTMLDSSWRLEDHSSLYEHFSSVIQEGPTA